MCARDRTRARQLDMINDSQSASHHSELPVISYLYIRLVRTSLFEYIEYSFFYRDRLEALAGLIRGRLGANRNAIALPPGVTGRDWA